MSSASQRSKFQLQPRPQGAGVVTESVAFKLVCDMQHLRGKVDIMCNLGATFAQRWVEEVVQRPSPLHVPHLLEHHHHQQQLPQHQAAAAAAADADAAEARLRDELEELVLELVDTSVEIQRMKERKDLALRFFCLAERRPSWSPPVDDEESDEEYNENEMSSDEELEKEKSDSRRSGCDSRTMMQLIDLDECEQVIDRLTTVLLGYLTAGEREEEERAICKRHHALAAEASAQGATMVRLPFVDEDDMFR